METSPAFLNHVIVSLQMVSLLIQTAFMGWTATRAGVRIIVRRDYVDCESGEVFQTWQGLRGFRLFLLSRLV